MTNPSSTTITILPARLKLVRLPRHRLQHLMAPILDCWWFRKQADPFFSLCSNEVEVSIFADADTVDNSFQDFINEPTTSSSGSEFNDDDEQDQDEAFESAEDDAETEAGESGITLGTGTISEGDGLERARRKLRREEKKKSQDRIDEDRVKVGEDVWVVLECAFHGDGWEEAGRRVRDLSSPLAQAGVSILFLSTYNSDFLLVKDESLDEVTTILEESGFQFTATDEDEDDDRPLAASTSDLHRGGSFRRGRARAGSNSTYSSGVGRAGGSLSGSLIMSDRGSSHEGSLSRTPNSAPATTVMSRSASINSRIGTATSSLQQASLSPIISTHTELSPDQNQSSAPSSPSVPRAVSLPAFTASNSLSILPDELVCIGLSQQHETLWRSKIVECLFFPERVLPRHTSIPAPPRSLAFNPSSPVTSRIRNDNRRSSPLSSPSISRKPSSRHAHGESPSMSSSHILSPLSPSTALHPLAAPFVSTKESEDPTPFIALTQTSEGVSLTADVRLLRKVFKEGEDEDVCFTVGQGGLRGIWQGEDGVSDEEDEDSAVDEDEDEEDEGAEEGSLRRGRERTRSTGMFETSVSPGLDERAYSGNESSGSRSSGSRDVMARSRERRERKLKAKQAGDGGRRLLKCLQMDLASFGLDKFGIVQQVAGLLVDDKITCLYQSTFATANILVSKNDIIRARRILEEHSQFA